MPLVKRVSAVTNLLSAFGPIVDFHSKLEWSRDDGTLPLLRVAVLRRQYECLSVAASLVESAQGYAAVGMLRAACEEYMWIKYLARLSRVDAEQLVTLLAQSEKTDSLKAQDDYVGRRVTKELGLEKERAASEAGAALLKKQRKTLGTRLRWEPRTIEAGKLPSIAFIAKVVDETRLYQFLYHASSRYVHFSPAELLRRAWGRTGSFSVSSAHFSGYWDDFVLYWGVTLFIKTLPELINLGLDISDDSLKPVGEAIIEAAKSIAEHGAVPIITAEELRWED